MMRRTFILQCFVFGCLFRATLQLQETTTTAVNESTVPQKPLYRVATVLKEPWVMKTAEGYTGFMVDLLHEVSLLSNFDYLIQESSNGRYGKINYMTGEYDGIVGDVIQGKADIGATDLIISNLRQEVVTFTKPFMSTGAQILLQRPKAPTASMTLLLWPFSFSVWLLILISMICVCAAFYVIERFSPFGWRRRTAATDTTSGKQSFNLGKCLLFVLSTVTWQGYREVPKSISGRILAICWWSFTLFVLLSYTASLTCIILAMGSSLKPVLPFKTFDEMARQSDVTYGGWFGMKLNPNDALHRTIDRHISSQYTYYNDLTQAVSRIRESGNFAAIVTGSEGQYITENNCDLIMLRELLFEISYGMVCPLGIQGQTLCNKITMSIMLLQENGQIWQLRNKWWTAKSKCTDIKEDAYVSGANMVHFSARTLNPTDLAYAFIELLVGVILSGLALLAEIVYRRRRPANETDTPAEDKKTPGIQKLNSQEDLARFEIKESTNGVAPRDDDYPSI